MADASFNRGCVVQVVFLLRVRKWHNSRYIVRTYNEDDSAKITSDLQVALGHLLAERNNDGASLAS